MTKLSACIEMLFKAESSDPAQRIHLAKAEGFEAVEFWLWSNKDLDAIERALDQTGVKLAGIVAEPFAKLTNPKTHDHFLRGLEESRDVALRLGAPVLICQSGNNRLLVDRQRQRDALTLVLQRAADVLAGSGVKLGLEPLNDRVDHPLYFLTSTSEALDIMDAVDRPEIGITYDLYHSMVMGEDPVTVIGNRGRHIVHLHIADHPGRHQPGSGQLDLLTPLTALIAGGYDGYVGLEFRPIADTKTALVETRAALAPLMAP